MLQKWSTLIDSMCVTDSELSHTNSSNNLFPPIVRLSARTIGMDLISVSPMTGPGISIDKLKQIESEIKKENRDGKIESLVNDKEYIEKKIEEHPDFTDGSVIGLFYMDHKYGGTQSI